MIILTMESIRDYLNSELNKRNWKAADLARCSGLDTGLISNIMNGNRNMGTASATAIAKALHVPPEQVFRKAGLLPEIPKNDERTEELLFLYNSLPEREQENLISYVQIRVMMLDREGKL